MSVRLHVDAVGVKDIVVTARRASAFDASMPSAVALLFFDFGFSDVIWFLKLI